MKPASAIVSEVLKVLKENAVEGVSTWDLDKIAEEMSMKKGGKPAFKGFKGFPGSVCFAINDEIVHGIPHKKRILKNGDVVGMDFGVIYDGYYGDSAITVSIGEISEEAEKLLRVTKESLYKGIDQATPSKRLFDISRAVQDHVESNGFSVVTIFVGHGIGKSLHEDPQVPNYVPGNDNWGKSIRLKEGMVIAIEPMVNLGGPDVNIQDDGWTAVTKDGTLSAHFEHTVAITKDGPLILTACNE